MTEKRKVGFWLAVGIVFVPVIFSWFTLRQGHLVRDRIAAFIWLGLSLLIFATTGNKSTDRDTVTDTVAVHQVPTPQDTPMKSTAESVAKSEPEKQPEPAFSEILERHITRALDQCIEEDPVFQIMGDPDLNPPVIIARVQYITGCGEYDKNGVAPTMWKILSTVIKFTPETILPATIVKIQTITRNGAKSFTSVTKTDRLQKLLNRQMGFEDWKIYIKEGMKNIKESDFFKEEKRLMRHFQSLAHKETHPDPVDESVKDELIAMVEDLDCVEEVTKAVFGKKQIELDYTESCGNYEKDSMLLTMYDVLGRVFRVFRKRKVGSGISLRATAINGGRRVNRKLSYYDMIAPFARMSGVIDWFVYEAKPSSMDRRAGKKPEWMR